MGSGILCHADGDIARTASGGGNCRAHNHGFDCMHSTGNQQTRNQRQGGIDMSDLGGRGGKDYGASGGSNKRLDDVIDVIYCWNFIREEFHD